jgi:hypothetical protein
MIESLTRSAGRAGADQAIAAIAQAAMKSAGMDKRSFMARSPSSVSGHDAPANIPAAERAV